MFYKEAIFRVNNSKQKNIRGINGEKHTMYKIFPS